MPFAGLVHRFFAACLDVGFLYVTVVMVAMAANPAVGLRESVGIVPLVLLITAWFGVLPATRLHGTPGKRLAGIKVTDMHGNTIGIARSLARFLLSLLTLATIGLGFVTAQWNGKRQALHDLGARTLVVERKFRPDEIAGVVAPPTWWFNRVLGILGLAAFLVAVYILVSTNISMRKRTEIGIAILAVRPFQRDVEKAVLEGKPIPAPPSNPDRRIRALAVQPDGKVVLELAEDLNPGGRLYFTPTRNARGIEWKCRSENLRRVHMGALCAE